MKYTAVMLVLLLMACGGGSSLDEKKAELKKLKKEAAALDKEIAALQLEIIRSDSSLKTADIKVRVNEIRPGLFQHFLNVDGVVKTDEDVMVNPEFQGRIEQLFVTEGTSVSKGQILAKISTDVLVEQLNELKTRYELARTVFEKQSRLWAQKIGSEMQYLQAKNNKEALEKSIARISKQLNLAEITSPINGTVETVFVKKGAYASPMQPFARIVNMDRSYVEADVAESYITNIHAGDSVTVRIENQADIRSTIEYIGNIINPQNRSFKIKAGVGTNSGNIKVNTLVELLIADIRKDSALVVPSACVQKDIRGNFLFVVGKNKDGQDIATKKYIVPGSSNRNNETLVTAGLSANELVIAGGYNQVSNGVPVEIVK